MPQGLTNRAIGERCSSRGGTVKTHLAHVYAKLGAANRAEVAAEHSRHASRSAALDAGVTSDRG